MLPTRPGIVALGLAFAAAGTLVTAPVPVRAADGAPGLRPVVLGFTARTAYDWPTYVADRLGFFTANGVKPDILVVGSAAAAAQQVTAGSLDIGEVSSTQAIEAIEGGAPIVAILALHASAPYAVVGKKGVTSIAALKGKTAIVGGPNDVTRVFMDTVLEKNGLRGEAVTYTFAGTTGDRYAALLSGTVDAAILNPPFSFRAIDDGYPVLDQVRKYYPHFMQGVFAARVDWARGHADLVVATIKAYLQAVRWLYDPLNKARAVQILAEATNARPEDALKTYDLYITQLRLFPSAGAIAAPQVGEIQEILLKTKVLKPPAAAPVRYFDNHYAEEANVQLRGHR